MQTEPITKRVTDTLIFGNFFISLCAAALVLQTYLLLGHEPVLDKLTYFVFFSTLALYNFHRLIGIRRIKEEDRGLITGWAARHQFTLLMLTLIGIGGSGFFVFQLSGNVQMLMLLIPLGAISLFYELPLVKFHKGFHRLRNLWLSKAFLITAVWALTTGLLPAMNIHFSARNVNVWLIVIERMIFIFILALCFDSRDVMFDLKENLKTIPIIYGSKKVKRLYLILTTAFIVISCFHYGLLLNHYLTATAMTISALLTLFLVSQTQPRRSDYYYMYLIDGMMIAQFLLTLLAVMIGH